MVAARPPTDVRRALAAATRRAAADLERLAARIKACATRTGTPPLTLQTGHRPPPAPVAPRPCVRPLAPAWHP